MAEKDKSEKETNSEQKHGLSNFLFSKNKRDKNYVPDLKKDWGEMAQKQRRQFILGLAAGVILLIILVVLVGLFINVIRGHAAFQLVLFFLPDSSLIGSLPGRLLVL